MMTQLLYMTKRNIKLFFKDKGMFFASLITPLILLVLYATFLGKVYKDSFTSSMPETLDVSVRIIDGVIAGQLTSSILAVSCVTVSFCSNMIMVNDKATKAINDYKITPVKSYMISLSYYIATLISTLIIVYVAFFACLIYTSAVGFFMSASDVFLIMLDVLLVTMFGLSLSSIINFFLKSQGQISAVGTIVSAGYGFICGAYMPLSNFSKGLQNVLSFLPGTYGTSLFRNHCMQGALKAFENEGIPVDVIDKIKTSVDCNLFFFDNKVSIVSMYLVIVLSVVVLFGIYVLMNYLKERKAG